jgi:hypothetical protein
VEWPNRKSFAHRPGAAKVRVAALRCKASARHRADLPETVQLGKAPEVTKPMIECVDVGDTQLVADSQFA